jgi:hypothetical protein
MGFMKKLNQKIVQYLITHLLFNMQKLLILVLPPEKAKLQQLPLLVLCHQHLKLR